jgi:hypothetical protein
MAYYDHKLNKIIYSLPKKSEYPGWLVIDCGCSSGLQWGGEQPRECRRCEGIGYIYFHTATGIYAVYPGGPLRGRQTKEERDASKTR